MKYQRKRQRQWLPRRVLITVTVVVLGLACESLLRFAFQTHHSAPQGTPLSLLDLAPSLLLWDSDDDRRTEPQHYHAPESSSSYRYPLQEFPPPFSNSTTLPLPFQILDQYIQWHSVDNLERDPYNRKFLLAHYRCPLSAGNRLHEFTSAFLWAILTNRTLLYKYFDRDECLRVRQSWNWKFKVEQCDAANTERDCRRMLLRAPWIPSFDEVASKFNLSIGRADRSHGNFTTSSNESTMIHYNYHVNYRATSNRLMTDGVDRSMDASPNNTLPILISIRPWPKRLDYLYYQHKVRNQQLATVYSKQTLFQLHEWAGKTIPFVFGLLFRYSFDWSPELQRYMRQQYTGKKMKHHNPFTFVLHSRHIFPLQNANDTALERDCLQRLLQQYKTSMNMTANEPTACRAVLLSDRQETLRNLSDWLGHDVGCEPLVANVDRGDAASTFPPGSNLSQVFNEHGPFSGIGFFRDLVLAGAVARGGMIGELEGQPRFKYNRWRSSSELIEEVVEYYRRMERWSMYGQDPKGMPNLQECTLVHEPDDAIAEDAADKRTSKAKKVSNLVASTGASENKTHNNNRMSQMESVLAHVRAEMASMNMRKDGTSEADGDDDDDDDDNAEDNDDNDDHENR